MRVLHVIADPKPLSESVTCQLAQMFMRSVTESNPIVRLTEVNLYHDKPPYLDYLMYRFFWNPLNDPHYMPTDRDRIAAGYALDQCYRLNHADLVVFTAPMWNLSLPAIMKAWLDAVIQPGYVYNRTPAGTVVYHAIKKVVLITSSAQMYREDRPPECTARLIRSLSASLLIDDVTVIWAQGQEMHSQLEQERRKDVAMLSARKAGVAIATHMV